ncbi:MAG: MurR/RpiR family transcriptional regulator [Paracoccus sp. (in: a-proteobacteria)]|nr:MurR/RpiR family transcriptional regulator [Paracoccus sp. (in: a-proteobacteria)]
MKGECDAAATCGEGDLREVLQALLPDLSAREARAARHLIANFPLGGLVTVAELAAASGVSTATVLRLVRRLGFGGYAQFQSALKSQLEIRLQSPLTRLDRQTGTGGDYIDAYFAGLAQDMEQMRAGLDRAAFAEVTALLADPKRDIHVIGGRYSGHVGRYFAGLLGSIRGRVRAVDADPNEHPPHLLDIGRNSVIVVFDVRRYQPDVIAFALAAAAQKARVVLLTDPLLSPAARVASHVLTFPVASPSIFDVMTGGMAMADALLGSAAHTCAETGRARMAQLESLRDAQAAGK